MTMSRRLLALLLAFCFCGTIAAHDGESHDDGVAVAPDAERAKLPIEITPAFDLIDHDNNAVTDAAYRGNLMLVFFGYVSCKNMCGISLARISGAIKLLGDDARRLSPLVITVDPARDTPAQMKAALQQYHPRLIGLTGDPAQLAAVYKNYRQNPRAVGDDWEGDAVISHSSYIYLIDANGKFATLFPPILNPQSMASIIRKYLDAA